MKNVIAETKRLFDEGRELEPGKVVVRTYIRSVAMRMHKPDAIGALVADGLPAGSRLSLYPESESCFEVSWSAIEGAAVEVAALLNTRQRRYWYEIEAIDDGVGDALCLTATKTMNTRKKP